MITVSLKRIWKGTALLAVSPSLLFPYLLLEIRITIWLNGDHRSHLWVLRLYGSDILCYLRISWIYSWQECSQACKLLLSLLLRSIGKRFNSVNSCLRYTFSQQQWQICWNLSFSTWKNYIFAALFQLSSMADQGICRDCSAYGSVAQNPRFCAWVMCVVQ